MQTEAIITDTETSGFGNHPVHGHPQVVQLAFLVLSGNLPEDMKFFRELNAGDPNIMTQVETHFTTFNGYYNPSMEMAKQAIEVHGLSHEWLEQNAKAPSEDVLLDFPTSTTKYVIGHQISYDKRCLNLPNDSGLKYICTKELAKSVGKVKALPKGNHLKNLIEYFYPKDHSNLTLNSHTAHYDTLKTGLLLAKLLEAFPGIQTYDDLYSFQQVN